MPKKQEEPLCGENTTSDERKVEEIVAKKFFEKCLEVIAEDYDLIDAYSRHESGFTAHTAIFRRIKRYEIIL